VRHTACADYFGAIEVSAGPTHDELVDLLRLSLIPGVGPRTRQALLEKFGSPKAVLAAAPSQLRGVQGVGPKLTGKIAAADCEVDVEEEIALCREHGIEILTEMHDGYPRVLREIHDPPGVLFVRGALRPDDALAVGIVGTRHASPYGLRQAERLAGSLARAGLTIISGLARGIDAAAHRGALSAGGRTIAVLASGVLCIYPPEHDTLAAEVAAAGAVISESPARAVPLGVYRLQREKAGRRDGGSARRAHENAGVDGKPGQPGDLESRLMPP
jgi:DNA processing protein